jgi:hypothetical protein
MFSLFFEKETIPKEHLQRVLYNCILSYELNQRNRMEPSIDEVQKEIDDFTKHVQNSIQDQIITEETFLEFGELIKTVTCLLKKKRTFPFFFLSFKIDKVQKKFFFPFFPKFFFFLFFFFLAKLLFLPLIEKTRVELKNLSLVSSEFCVNFFFRRTKKKNFIFVVFFCFVFLSCLIFFCMFEGELKVWSFLTNIFCCCSCCCWLSPKQDSFFHSLPVSFQKISIFF